MENYDRPGIHDTIDLKEIKDLLQEGDADAVKEEPISREQTECPGQPAQQGFVLNLYEMLHDLVYILGIVMVLFVFVVRLVGVEGTSMVPTLLDKDFLILESNFLYGAQDIQCGDIVVLNVPYYWQRDKSLIVKRVIATQGQRVDIDYETSTVYVDGIALQENYINEQLIRKLWEGSSELKLPATVPDGHIFVLGDNRNASSDSRFAPVGMIDERCVLGKAWAIAIPGMPKDSAGNTVGSRDWSRIGLVY